MHVRLALLLLGVTALARAQFGADIGLDTLLGNFGLTDTANASAPIFSDAQEAALNALFGDNATVSATANASAPTLVDAQENAINALFGDNATVSATANASAPTLVGADANVTAAASTEELKEESIDIADSIRQFLKGRIVKAAGPRLQILHLIPDALSKNVDVLLVLLPKKEARQLKKLISEVTGRTFYEESETLPKICNDAVFRLEVDSETCDTRCRQRGNSYGACRANGFRYEQRSDVFTCQCYKPVAR